MHENEMASKWSIWWKYLKSEKRILWIWGIHIAISVVIFLAIRKASAEITISPEKAEALYDSMITVIGDYIKGETRTDGKWQWLKVAIFVLSLLAYIWPVKRFLARLTKNRYDAAFMKLEDQKSQNVGLAVFSVILFAITLVLIAYIIGLMSDTDPDFPAIWVLLTVTGVMMVGIIVHNVMALKDTGRSDFITYLISFYIVWMIVICPVNKDAFLWTLPYIVLVTIIAISLLHWQELIFRNDQAIYCFMEKEDGGTEKKLYIHYRLDDDRLICAETPMLPEGQKRIIYNISDLCKREIIWDTSNYDKEWKETVAVLRKIRESEAEHKNKEKEIEKAKKETSKIEKKKKRNEEKALKEQQRKEKSSAKIASLNAKINEQNKTIKKLSNENDKLKKAYEDSENSLKKIQDELEELKKNNKGA